MLQNSSNVLSSVVNNIAFSCQTWPGDSGRHSGALLRRN